MPLPIANAHMVDSTDPLMIINKSFNTFVRANRCKILLVSLAFNLKRDNTRKNFERTKYVCKVLLSKERDKESERKMKYISKFFMIYETKNIFRWEYVILVICIVRLPRHL